MAGRPALLTAIIGRNTETGDDITVHDRIVNALRAGSYFEQATAFAGVHKDTGYGWLAIAGRIRIRTGGDPNPAELTAHERDCLRFSDAVAEADAQWEVQTLLTLERLGRGGIPQVKTVVKRGPSPQPDVEGPILEVTTTTEHTLPNVQVLLWRLERRIPKRYRRPTDEDADRGDTPDGLTIEDRQVALLDGLDAYLDGVADEQARQATVVVETPAPVKVTKPRRRRRTSE